ncbi:hypothetical protein NH340_JMT07583 [Sarcoptes scabiei]|nr:hypothetical protein NH340_JMT07583 [Sarcoptes scabiei]
MSHWGEIPLELDRKSHKILLQSISPIIEPNLNEFDSNPEYFAANRYFRTDQSGFDSDDPNEKEEKQSSKSKTSNAFLETIRLIIERKIKKLSIENGELESNQTSSDQTEMIGHSKCSMEKLIRESIILITTHSGYDFASNNCLDLLADLFQYYLRCFFKLLRSFTDSKCLQSSNDFHDIVDKTLHHMNIPNVEALRQYHQSLIDYLEKIKKCNRKNEQIKMKECKDENDSDF